MKQSLKQNKPQISVQKHEWAGPLPPPSVLSEFDRVVQGGAERIMRMAESEQSHRHGIEKAIIDAETKAKSRGYWLGFLVSITSMAGAVGTIMLGGHWAVSVALVGVPIASIVKAFVSK